MPSQDLTLKRFLLYAAIIGGIFALVRIIFFRQLLGSPVYPLPILDSEFYYYWALRLSSGHGNPPGPFWLSPFYPYFMAGLFKGSGSTSMQVVAVVQFLLSLVSLGAMVWMTRVLFGFAVALVACGLAALYGPWVYYDGMILSTSLILALNALMLWLLIVRFNPAEDAPPSSMKRDGIFALAGLLAGLSALARPSLLIFGAVLTVWLLLQKSAGHFRRAVFFAGAIFICLVPVLIRNWQVSGNLLLTTSSGGVNFFIGNRAGASGIYDELDFIKSFDPQREAEGYRVEASKRSHKNLTLNQADRFWFLQAADDIVHAPAGWIRLLMKKGWLTLQREEIANNLSFRGVAGFTPILGALPIRWGLLLPLAVVGMWLSWRKRRDLNLLWLYGLSYLAANLVFFSSSEYRFPLILILFPAAACFLVELWPLLQGKDYKRLIIAIGIYVVALLLCNLPTEEMKRSSSPKADYYNMATVAVDRGMVIDAVPLFARSLSVDPTFNPARVGLAKALWALGNFDEAREEFARAGLQAPDSVSGSPIQNFLNGLYVLTEANEYEGALKMLNNAFPPDQPAPLKIWSHRALVLSELHRYDDAIAALRKAAELDPSSPEWPYKAGFFAVKAHRPALADSLFKEALEHYSAFAPARIALGNLALDKKDTLEAKAQLDQLRLIRIPEDSLRQHVWKLAKQLGEDYDPKMP